MWIANTVFDAESLCLNEGVEKNPACHVAQSLQKLLNGVTMFVFRGEAISMMKITHANTVTNIYRDLGFAIIGIA